MSKSVFMQNWFTFFKMKTLCIFVSLLFALLMVSSCNESPHLPGYGLPFTFAIYVDEGELSAMRTGLHVKPKVPARIWINDDVFDAKILHSGATSIKNFRRSYELYLDKPFECMRVFRLNAMVGDYSTMNATLAYHAYELVGFKMPRYEPVALWVNDEYYGVYHLQQLFTDSCYWKNAAPDGLPPQFMYQASKALMGSGAEIYANLDQKFSAKYGSKEYVGLEEFIRRLASAPSDEGRQRIEELGDVNQILLYMAMTQYLMHRDGINNNFFFVSTALHPRFHILPWDLDVTFFGNASPDDGTIFETNHMMRRFFYVDAPYRSLFEQYIQFIHNRLTPENMLPCLDKYYDLVKDAWQADEYRNARGKTLEEYRYQLEARFYKTRENYHNYLVRTGYLSK
ncbi:MAG: CotH kinase family protein [Deltaproteobacteria bacterium]|nr:CotH kinase family protein [Deltaproteobacteria bacterium]